METLNIIENILPRPLHLKLEYEVQRRDFPYYYFPEMVYNGKLSDASENICFEGEPSNGMSHLVLDQETGNNSNYVDSCCDILKFLIDALPYKNLEMIPTRIKFNLTFPNGNGNKHGYPHVDPLPPHDESEEYDHWIFLYYINNSDGDTIIFNETTDEVFEKPTIRCKYTPKENTALFFKGNIYHAASNPIKTKARFNINYNVLVKEN